MILAGGLRSFLRGSLLPSTTQLIVDRRVVADAASIRSDAGSFGNGAGALTTALFFNCFLITAPHLAIINSAEVARVLLRCEPCRPRAPPPQR